MRDVHTAGAIRPQHFLHRRVRVLLNPGHEHVCESIPRGSRSCRMRVRFFLRIAAAVLSASAVWLWPVTPPTVIRAFQEPEHRYGPGHRGIDIAVSAASPVTAAADGTIAFAGQVAGRGVVSVDHPGGFRSSIEPVDSSLSVGTWVRRGDPIGYVSDGGHCADACVHFGVRKDGRYVDPLLLLLSGVEPVLLPL